MQTGMLILAQNWVLITDPKLGLSIPGQSSAGFRSEYRPDKMMYMDIYVIISYYYILF
jgi:hypothetical protein